MKGFALNCFKDLRRAVFACLATVLGCALHGQVLANVWKVVDENGVIQFTNEPPGKKGQLVIESEGNHSVVTNRSDLPAIATEKTVAVINASPAYQAVHGSLSSASQSYGVDYDLIKAVVATESAFNSKAVSPKGAVGLMQIMPTTAQRYGVQPDRGATISTKLTDPDLNIQTGTRYLADLLRLFGGQTELALAAYNAGEGAVARAGNRIPNYKETQSYVVRVMSIYRLLQTRTG
jgi:soluble lytic murein transglycosylase-like protein